MKIFGFEISRKKEIDQQLVSFSPKEQDDGATVVASGGVFGTVVDLEGSIKNEAEFISKYRDMANNPEVDDAINEIVNETIAMDEKDPVNINLDDLDKIQIEITDPIRQALNSEFNEILKLLDFNNRGYDIYRRWYIDGRLFFHAIIDNEQPQNGILELREIDPRKIHKVREIQKQKLPSSNSQQNAVVQKTASEYYIFNDRGFGNSASQNPNIPSSGTATGLKIAKDSIINIVSGVTDPSGKMVMSYLHKAIKPLNQLRALEDAVVIYRLSRAPERRVWFIDVGNLPKAKAEQYMREIMNRHKNRLIYDANTGDIKNDRKFLTMLEDYWLTRREGGRGTEVETLPAGQNLGQMEDVLYFQKRLYKSLNVPSTRLEETSPFDMGQPTAITKDEVKFNKFIVRLRLKFCQLFLKCLERQLILKNILTYEDWLKIKPYIRFDFAKDNYFTELKELEILNSKFTTLQMVDPSGIYVGKYYSHKWVRQNIIKMTDEEMAEIDQEIQSEMQNPLYNPDAMFIASTDKDSSNSSDDQDKNNDDSVDQNDEIAIMAEKTYKKLYRKSNLTPIEKNKLEAAKAYLAKKKK